LREGFVNRKISTKGFNYKFKKLKNRYLKLQLYIGIPLLLISGVIILIGENFLGKSFNGIQLIFLKMILSLSIATVGSTIIEGNADAKWSLNIGLTVRAVGWLAVFLILYFFNPANPGDVY